MEPPSIALIVENHIIRVLEETGLAANIPKAELRAALDSIGLGLGQLLADVERARRQEVPLSAAVHAHEQYPYLCRFHGHLHDAFVMNVPQELVPIMRHLAGLPAPGWAIDLHDSTSIIARSELARPEERALATLILFEGVRINLFMSAYRMNGWFEGVGGCRRDLDDLAWEQTAKVLAMPIQAVEDALTFAVIVADALKQLSSRVDQLWKVNTIAAELRVACERAAAAEMLFRRADPVDAAVLRHYFDRSCHQQPLPLSRLPLEHPLILAGHNENSLNKRTERAIEKLTKKVRLPKPTTFADLILEAESTHA